ncbi:hypothetical protein LJC20_01505 [Eubacteriales bacterium OttesenSCG-928-M02]|nr:hypothetical protein [Eubacteriales bacterium OttesenSCG-928-M02]
MQQKERRRLWAMVKKRQRMVADVVLPLDEEDALAEPLTRVCQKLDLERPVVLPKHERDMASFHRTAFKARDFIDAFPYDSLDIVEIIEKKEDASHGEQ